MGKQRVSTRTLPSGEQVIHHPPTDAHPEGQMFLVRTGSPLRDRLDALRATHHRRHRELGMRRLRHVAIKKHRQAVRGLPHEKSPV